MRTMQKSMEINATAERVFDYVSDPKNLPGIWPSLVEVSSVERKPDGWHSFSWIYKMAGLHFRGQAKTTEIDRPKFYKVHNEGGIPSDFIWSFAQRGTSTLVELKVDYNIPTPVIGKLAEVVVLKMNEREAETLLLNLKSAVESLVSREATVQARA